MYIVPLLITYVKQPVSHFRNITHFTAIYHSEHLTNKQKLTKSYEKTIFSFGISSYDTGCRM